MSNHIIEQERHGLWIAVTFIIALLALGLSINNMRQTHALAVGTQIEVLALHKSIKKNAAAPAAEAPAPAPAAAAPVAAEASK